MRPERIAVVPPGTAKPTFHSAAAIRRSRSKLLCVASLVPRKGHGCSSKPWHASGISTGGCYCVGSLERDRRPRCAKFDGRLRPFASGGVSHSRGERPPEAIARAYRGGRHIRIAVISRGVRNGLCGGDGARPAGDRDDCRRDSRNSTSRSWAAGPPGDPICLGTRAASGPCGTRLAARLAAGSRATGARLPDWPRAASSGKQLLIGSAALVLAAMTLCLEVTRRNVLGLIRHIGDETAEFRG